LLLLAIDKESSDLAHALTNYMLFLIVWWPVDVLVLQSGVWIMLKPSSKFVVAKTCLLTIMSFSSILWRTTWLLPAMQWKGISAPAVSLLATSVIHS
jgi:hypothetical protein